MALLFQSPRTEKWRLHELGAILDSIEDEIEVAIGRNQVKTGHNFQNLILRSAGKSIVNMREIITLVACGYPDGALSLSRNLFEQLIILVFFEGKRSSSDFNNYVEDFFTDYDIQRINALIYECKKCIPDNAEGLTTLNEQLAKAKEKRHSQKGGTYWWSGHSTFYNLTESVIESQPQDAQRFLHVLYLHYKRACIALHASCMGNELRLGTDPDFVGISTVQTEKGHGMPLWFATTSLNYILSCTFTTLELEYQKYEDVLFDLISFYREKEFEK